MLIHKSSLRLIFLETLFVCLLLIPFAVSAGGGGGGGNGGGGNDTVEAFNPSTSINGLTAAEARDMANSFNDITGSVGFQTQTNYGSNGVVSYGVTGVSRPGGDRDVVSPPPPPPPPLVRGCTDTAAINYQSSAQVNDGSCIARVTGCTDTSAINYNPSANTNDGSCIARVTGCRDSSASNYNPSANSGNDSTLCEYYGCTDSSAFNFEPDARVDDGSCIARVFGCIDSNGVNFDNSANTTDNSCIIVQPTLTTEVPIARVDSKVLVNWNPGDYTSCTLSLYDELPLKDFDQPGSGTFTQTRGETNLVYTCVNGIYTATAEIMVKSLPVMSEF
ncbi:MAG: hypothetical protein ACI92I_000571 [Acidimicrobiales bacterium]|jgi:hypothetical protein